MFGVVVNIQPKRIAEKGREEAKNCLKCFFFSRCFFSIETCPMFIIGINQCKTATCAKQQQTLPPHEVLLCVRACDTQIFLWFGGRYNILRVRSVLKTLQLITISDRWIDTLTATFCYWIWQFVHMSNGVSADLHALIVIIITSIISDYINWHFDTWINALLLIKSVCNSFDACIFHERSLLQFVRLRCKDVRLSNGINYAANGHRIYLLI